MACNPILAEFEKLTGLKARETACLLRIAYPTYAAYRNCSRELPPYHAGQVEHLTTHQALAEIIQKEVHGIE